MLTISYGSYAMDQRSGWLNQWMVSNLRQTPDFEVLDSKIASALNKIIRNTRFKGKVSLEEMKAQKEDRCLRGRQIAYLIYEYFRVTGRTYLQFFFEMMMIFRNSIRNRKEFY